MTNTPLTYESTILQQTQPANPDSRPTPIICFYARVRPRVDGGSPGRSNQPDMWGPGARALSAVDTVGSRVAALRTRRTQRSRLAWRGGGGSFRLDDADARASVIVSLIWVGTI